MDAQLVDHIYKIKKTTENIAVTVGILFGTILGIYFFSMSELVNRGMTGALWFLAISSVLLVIGLVFVRKLAFKVTRTMLGNKPQYQAIFAAIVLKDLEQDAETLAQRIGQQ